jgi:hypothetical protein
LYAAVTKSLPQWPFRSVKGAAGDW